MEALSGQARADREPFWEPASDGEAALPILREDAEADVCVVGAGIAGLTTAYLLSNSGKRVIVLEQDRVGAGETGRTTAHLTAVLDSRYHRLREIHGDERARLVAASHAAAIDLVETLVRVEAMECDFRRLDGYLMADDDHAARSLELERDAAQAAGLAVELLPRAPLPYETGPALRFANQAELDPLRYLTGLARAFRGLGGTLAQARAIQFEQGDEPRVRTASGAVVRARSTVVATHSPVNERVGVHTRQAAYRSYVIGASIPTRSVPPGLYWDTHDPYHYVRVASVPDRDVLLVGGEDHRTGRADDAQERYDRLERWARDRFDGVTDVTHRWSGQVLEPSDGLAHIGRESGGATNAYVATGFSGNGMTYGTIAGRLIADLVLGRANPWAPLYDPARITAGAATRYLKMGVDALAQYGERVTSGEVESPAEVPVGTGAVMQRGLSKLAVYKDAAGGVHTLSAVCPHLGCIVHWNGSEKTWDCPCHGSRFASDGALLNGPATRPLAPVADEAAASLPNLSRHSK